MIRLLLGGLGSGLLQSQKQRGNKTKQQRRTASHIQLLLFSVLLFFHSRARSWGFHAIHVSASLRFLLCLLLSIFFSTSLLCLYRSDTTQGPGARGRKRGAFAPSLSSCCFPAPGYTSLYIPSFTHTPTDLFLSLYTHSSHFLFSSSSSLAPHFSPINKITPPPLPILLLPNHIYTLASAAAAPCCSPCSSSSATPRRSSSSTTACRPCIIERKSPVYEVSK